ncbi:SEL1-like repeat protein [Helicobacter didelphidarum]|nr:hypothetical protein [Helicobacter didelphidarum]
MKRISNNVHNVFLYGLCGFFLLFFLACTSNSNPKHSQETDNDISGIIQLHKNMNEKHGKTDGYYANLAVADGDYDKSYQLHYQECKLGSVIGCLNAYYIGEERSLRAYDSDSFAIEFDNSIHKSIHACKKNESLGCVNLFFAFDVLNDDDEFVKNIATEALDGHNNDMIVDKALNMTKKECEQDDATSCFFHARMLRIMDSYADVEYYIDKGLDLSYVLAPFVRLPMQSPQTIDYFKRSCALNEALSCRYVAYWFDKYEDDTLKGKQFYKKACNLGLNSACEEATKPVRVQTDELGSPVINRR